jgi:hypothetical protein
MTTNDPFAINEKPVTQFGNLFLSFEEKQGSNGSRTISLMSLLARWVVAT